MIILSLTDIHVSYGVRTILQGASLEVHAGEKVALVGANGAGKTTLLKVATGEQETDAGTRSVRKDTRIGYVAQALSDESDTTVWQEARSIFSYVDALEAKLARLHEALGQVTTASPPPDLAQDYENTLAAFTMAGGYEVDSRVRKVLSGMRFDARLQLLPIIHLSGGQKTRLQLAKLLLSEPDLLILDEPTNYLDMETVQWLETHLEQYKGALLVVSHDRYFLDRVARTTYDLQNGRSIRYPGNYSTFAELKTQREIELLQSYEQQQTEIARMEDFIARNIVRASTTKRAQSRRKALERMEMVERPAQTRSAVLRLSTGQPSGKIALRLNEVTVQFTDTPLFPPLTVQIQRGEHIAILGQNGVGKTSLLKGLMGEQSLLGDVRFGTGVTLSYYDQEQHVLNSSLTVIEQLWQHFPQKTETEIRTRLGQLLFSGDDVFKPVMALSGGERSRLALATLSFSEANFLLLDEPTNHLDLPSKEVLEEALLEYEGTLIFVSHDRYFINRIATRILYFTPDAIMDHMGDYDDFLGVWEQTRTQVATQGAAPKSEANEERLRRKQQRNSERQRQERIAQLESQVEEIEKQKAAIEALLSLNTTYDDPQTATQQSKIHQKLQVQLDELYDEWTRLSDDEVDTDLSE